MAGNDIGGVRGHDELANGGGEMAGFPRQTQSLAPNPQHEVRGRDERVGARVHRRRADVIRSSFDEDLEAGNANNGGNDPDISALPQAPSPARYGVRGTP